MKQYNITMTEGQLMVAFTALEWFFRMQMGQFFDYATKIAKDGYEYDKENPDNDQLFREYIYRRDECQEHMQIAYRIAHPRSCDCTEDMNIAIDMWQEIRYFCWKERPEPKPYDTVDSRTPLHRSSEPPIQIGRIGFDLAEKEKENGETKRGHEDRKSDGAGDRRQSDACTADHRL